MYIILLEFIKNRSLNKSRTSDHVEIERLEIDDEFD